MTRSGGKTPGSIIAKFNISAAVCGPGNKKKGEKAEFIIFREIKVPGNIPVIQYFILTQLKSVGIICGICFNSSGIFSVCSYFIVSRV